MLRSPNHLVAFAALAALWLAGCHWDWDQTCQGAHCASGSSTASGSSGSTGSGTARSSGSSTGSSGSTGSTGSSSGSTGGPCAPVADSATPLCADASSFIACADAPDAGVDGQDGQITAGSAYAQPSAGLTFDPVTGLTWQSEAAIGADDAGFTWADAAVLCTELDAGAFHDWRLPTVPELLSIDDLGKYPKAYDEAVFSFPNNDYNLWTASPSPTSGKAMRVTFYNGECVPDSEAARHPLRCVRGATCSGAPRFSSAGGVTYDSWTDLSWQQAWPTPRDWVSALAYCKGLQLGGAAWHLATVHELASLLDYSRTGTLLDPSAVTPQSSPSSQYGGATAWSSSPVGQTSSGAQSWFVNFEDGSVYRDARSDALNVACVHSGR